MKEVAEKLRSLRESVKLSQVKMAEIVGVKQSSLNRYELNQASPTFETLTQYADYFDVSMDYIFGRTDNPQGKLYEYKPKIQQSDPQMQKFVEMCFDPTSPMNARLKETLLQMLGGGGTMNVVIYARYSSHSQTEQSIEGQLHTCYEYARNNGYLVVGEYIDRAQSGTTDSRAEFQRMIADSDKHTFEGVLVYQLDRFARNRYDSAINKAKLKKNGVRVISARENISDDASGILVEGVLESMAEYYSAELSQKIRRGMGINAEKCLSNGSNPGLGYRVDEERRFHIDPEGAAVVREIFEQYASGKTVTEIIQSLNARQIKTSQGKAFNKNSLHRLLRNRRYIGYYIYKGVETPNRMPRILEDELFEVKSILFDSVEMTHTFLFYGLSCLIM